MRTSRALPILGTAFAVGLLLVASAPGASAQSASSSASAQSTTQAGQSSSTVSATLIGGPEVVSTRLHAINAAPITGAPYSSVSESRHKQTLANGTHIDRVDSVTHSYRDAQGRTRMDVCLTRPYQSEPERCELATIVDPVAGTSYSLDLTRHTATSIAYRGPISGSTTPTISMSQPSGIITSAFASAPASGERNPNAPTATRTPLGDDSILGDAATGLRTTFVYDVGALGNDQPITITRESWDSKDLHITLLSKNDDPRSGEITTRVTQLDRAEPDPSLFQIPSDFTITEK